MKETLLATYERKSTLWANANVFYHHQDWTKMECLVLDFSEEIKTSEYMRWVDVNGKDVTDSEVERRYGKPYCIRLTNNRETNQKSYCFKTKNEANDFFKQIMNNKILKDFRKVS